MSEADQLSPADGTETPPDGTETPPDRTAPLVLGRDSPAARAEPRLPRQSHGGQGRWVADGGSGGWFRLRVASVAGVRHRLGGAMGEDAYAWAFDDLLLAVAIADGVGSLPGSGSCAKRVVEAACRSALGSAQAGAEPAQAALAALADAEEVAQGEGAAAMVVAVATPDGQLCLARVGDCSAFLLDGEGWLELFEEPDPDRVGTETLALPLGRQGRSIEEAAQVTSLVLEPQAALVLASDGLADPWRDGPTSVAPVLAQGLYDLPAPLELLRLVDFARQGCHDDRSVAVLRLT